MNFAKHITLLGNHASLNSIFQWANVVMVLLTLILMLLGIAALIKYLWRKPPK